MGSKSRCTTADKELVRIAKAIKKATGYDPLDKSRPDEVVRSRFILYKILSDVGLSSKKIAAFTNRRCHSTILLAIRDWPYRVSEDRLLAEMYQKCLSEVGDIDLIAMSPIIIVRRGHAKFEAEINKHVVENNVLTKKLLKMQSFYDKYAVHAKFIDEMCKYLGHPIDKPLPTEKIIRLINGKSN